MAKTPKRDGVQAPPADGTSRPGRPAWAGRIVPTAPHPVKPETPSPATDRPGRLKTRRQSHGSAWHWRQTDYYTLPGTKKRVPLLDEDGARVRGKANKGQARLALARVKFAE
jgi:hypothetical protein